MNSIIRTYTVDGKEFELQHHGVKGMRWGVRKDRERNPRQLKTKPEPAVISKKGEIVDLHEDPMPVTGKFLAKLIPSLAEKQAAFSDYTIRSKDGKKVGTISTNKDSDESLNIVWLSVNGKYGGQGYAQSAMRTVIDDARNRGFRNITLEVPTISPNARHIYEKLGFRETGDAMLGDEDDVWGGLTKMRLDL